MPELLPPPADLDACRDLVRSGQITAALRLLEQLPPAPGDPESTARTLALLVECRLARGDLPGATRCRAVLLALATGTGLTGALATFALGELATARGEHESALGRYTAVGDRLGTGLDDPVGLPWRSSSALALTRLGRHREARLLAQEHLSLVRASGPPYAVAQALRSLAATDAVGPMDLLREARALLAGLSAHRLAAQVDTDLAVLVSLRPGSEGVGEAVALLRGAEAFAVREDLFPLHDRVRRQLERLGQRACRIRSETLASLTRTEQKTAQLAADGLTNREIAAAMRVTVKAVEWHLSHVYRKLGIPGRAGLVGSLGASA